MLVTLAREDDKLKGFSFSHARAHRRHARACSSGWRRSSARAKRDTVLRAIMTDQLRRAVLAFPDEDVLVGTRFTNASGFEAFKALDDIVPRPDHKATGGQACAVSA